MILQTVRRRTAFGKDGPSPGETNLTISTPQSSRTSGAANRRQVGETPEAEAAFRLMSETAHDIRSPLTTIRESIRLVHDGDLGTINDGQKECLAAAIDQCNCLDQMVGEMVQVERLRTGLPRARRSWVSLTSIRQAISETLRPWALPRDIRILWDGADNPNVNVFADASMIRRLVVNLVANAIRVTAEGESVLIRVQSVRDGEAMQWTVVDQGPGISEADLQEISKRQVSLGGGEGLGLTICRQLSALHFSPLQIESRVGTGTAVSFETAAGGPSSVAECWSRWRLQWRNPLRRPMPNDAAAAEDRKVRLARRIRIDNPTSIVILGSEGTQPRFEDRIAAGCVSLGAAMARQAADTFDKLLQTRSRMFDFVYRIDTRHWIWVFDANIGEAEHRLEEIDSIARVQIDNLRVSWSDPQMIPLDQRRTAARLSDLLVRQSLAAAKTRSGDHNQVRLGTAPIASSPVAANRLDEELHRLTERLGIQSAQIQQQAARLRPTR